MRYENFRIIKESQTKPSLVAWGILDILATVDEVTGHLWWKTRKQRSVEKKGLAWCFRFVDTREIAPVANLYDELKG